MTLWPQFPGTPTIYWPYAYEVSMNFTPHIYIAGPLMTGGTPELSVANAIKYAEILRLHNFAPYVPHLNWFWNLQHQNPEQEWLDLDFKWILRCDGLLRLPGASYGADKEMVFAQENNKPVYFSLHELFRVYKRTPDVEMLRQRFNIIVFPPEPHHDSL